MTPAAERMQRCIEAHEAAHQADSETVRELSFRERGAVLMSVCRSAAEIYRSRLAAGLPPEQPAPWPESTWQFLKAQAQRAQQQPSH